MIDLLYNLTRKGWLKALSFLLAGVMFVAIFVYSATFAQHFGGSIPYLAVAVFYAMAVLWIHGIGFEIKSTIWKLTFLPIVGYLILVPSLIYLCLQA